MRRLRDGAAWQKCDTGGTGHHLPAGEEKAVLRVGIG